MTTPYNLLRLLEHNTWLLCSLCHLVLDEIEVLFSDTTEKVNGKMLVQLCLWLKQWHTLRKKTLEMGLWWTPSFFSLFLFIFVFANYCVDRLGFSSSYQLVFAECLCPFRSALSRLTILQICTDPFPEISIFSGQNPALQLCAHAYAVTACGPVAFSYFRIHSKNRVKVYIPNFLLGCETCSLLW